MHYYDETTDSIITTETAQTHFREAIENGFTESACFADWLRNATDKNGALTQVYLYSVTFANGETITEYGANAVHAVKRYAVNHDMETYPCVIAYHIVSV